MIASLGARARWRVLDSFRRVLLLLFGRELRCEDCGRTLFRAIPLVHDGKVRILGAAEHDVRIAFGGKYTVELRHVRLDECPSPDRPWVR